MSPTPGVPDAELFDIYGPLEVGVLLSVFGFGLLAAIVYFENCTKGDWSTNSLILAVVALNFGQTISDCVRIMRLTTLHSADIVYFLDVRQRPSEIVSPIISVTIATITQLFLLRRCLQFAGVTENPSNRSTTKNRLRVFGLAGLGLAGILLSFACGLGLPIRVWLLDTYVAANQDHILTLVTTVWLATSAGVDILLSGYIIFKLRKAVKGNDDGNKVIDTLIKLSMQAGGLVTALQVIALILYTCRVASTWADFPAIFISKVYSMTLIASISRPRRHANVARQMNLPPGPLIPITRLPCQDQHQRVYLQQAQGCISSPTIINQSRIANAPMNLTCCMYSNGNVSPNIGWISRNENNNGIKFGIDTQGMIYSNDTGEIMELESEKEETSFLEDCNGRENKRESTLVGSSSALAYGISPRRLTPQNEMNQLVKEDEII
ncbi:uncharacterized protein L201_007930 [Kwoniella dendrophila CBS 6074]|uniref:DUF6534 domain-containing protein n=1 Tax=Kwoniella dendrophila CBS 6074 TaxID=1295534 RepID=A0AAX4K7Y2_9TREE